MTNRRETNKWITTLGSRVHLHRPAHGDVREQRAAAIWHQQCGSLSCGITLHRDTQRGLSRRRRGGAQHFALGQAPRGALRHLLSRAPSERQNARKKTTWRLVTCRRVSSIGARAPCAPCPVSPAWAPEGTRFMSRGMRRDLVPCECICISSLGRPSDCRCCVRLRCVGGCPVGSSSAPRTWSRKCARVTVMCSSSHERTSPAARTFQIGI